MKLIVQPDIPRGVSSDQPEPEMKSSTYPVLPQSSSRRTRHPEISDTATWAFVNWMSC